MNKSIKEIKFEFEQADEQSRSLLYAKYDDDTRAGVVSLIARYKKMEAALEKERERFQAMRSFDMQYHTYDYICGVDEVGRGPLAGPVVAGAVILPKDCDILYINDSKKLSEKKREELCRAIKDKALAIGIGVVDSDRIDEINILQATYEAMRLAIQNLNIKPDILLNDAVTIPGVDIRQEAIIKGDTKSISIAAASIVAKVTRDRMMIEYDQKFPGYDFASNKGYGSHAHIKGLKELGKTRIHRETFVKSVL